MVFNNNNNNNQNIIQQQYEINGLMDEIITAFTRHDRGRVLELIDIYYDEYQDPTEEQVDTHSPTECNFLEEIVYYKHAHGFRLIKWFIEEIANCPLDESRGIYMFYTLKAALFDGNIPLANDLINTFGNRFHTDYLYESKLVDDLIDELVENDEEYCNPAIIELVINTIYDNEYIARFPVMPYNLNHLNHNKERLINSIRHLY